MKIWLSKYALSTGITEHEAEVSEDGRRVYPGKPFGSFVSFSLGTEAHDTREGAEQAAEKSRYRKIASLEKQIKKLRKLSFAPPC